MEETEKVPVLVGCTASGKTGVLLQLAGDYDMEIISADSRQIYRGMDVGTAKPTAGEREILKHHLIDCVDPDEEYSAGRFREAAESLIEDIRARHRIPVISGGTVLYVMALTGGLDPMPKRSEGLRKGLKTLEEMEPGTLYSLLRRIDPERAGAVGENDTRRIVRSIEIFALTGKKPTSLRKGGDSSIREKYRLVGIKVSREEHLRRIKLRVDNMIGTGLVEEVQRLLEEGWGRESALGRTIGYTEVLDYLEGKTNSMEEMAENIVSNTWKLVRRQKNMYRRMQDIVWIDGDVRKVEEELLAEGRS